jgi:hypothetical protein
VVGEPDREATPLELLAEAEPIVDELCAWIDTDTQGCVEVSERGERLLRRIRETLERERGA